MPTFDLNYIMNYVQLSGNPLTPSITQAHNHTGTSQAYHHTGTPSHGQWAHDHTGTTSHRHTTTQQTYLRHLAEDKVKNGLVPGICHGNKGTGTLLLEATVE